MVSRDVDWINDWYDENYYDYSSEHNPVGPKHGETKVVRNVPSMNTYGKATVSRGKRHPSTYLDKDSSDEKNNLPGFGFRCAVHSHPLPEPTDEPPSSSNNG